MIPRMDMRSEQPFSHTRHSSVDGESRLHIVELARYVRTYKRRETSHNDTDKVDRLSNGLLP